MLQYLISYTQTSSDLYNLIYDSNKYSLCWCPQSSRMNIWYKICVTRCSEKCLIRVLSLFSSFDRIRYWKAKNIEFEEKPHVYICMTVLSERESSFLWLEMRATNRRGTNYIQCFLLENTDMLSLCQEFELHQ